MIYNTQENILYCKEIVDAVFSLLTYSHLFPIVACLVSFVLVMLSSSSVLIKKVFAGISFTFILWVLSNLAIWIFYDDNQVMMFAWSSIELLSVLLFIYLLYFMYILVHEKDVTNRTKLIWIILILPLALLSFTKYNLVGIDLSECVALENKFYILYSVIVKGILSLWLIAILFKASFKNKDRRRAVILAGSGSLIFYASFFTMGYFASLTGNYNLEFYGLFGMIVFIVFLALAVNRYKIINIRIISTELLVLAIILLVSSQFLYLQNTLALTLNLVTFILVCSLGAMLIKNIKSEIETREVIEKSATLLKEANQNQQSLLHFITHQVKGYMTKSRNIFDGMLTGDYGQMSDKVKEMAKYGFDSETRGVQTVQSILKASDLKTGKTEFRKEKTNLSAVVAEIVENRKDVAEQKKLDLTFEIEPNIEILVDPIQIREVFKNMISNAIIYTPKGTVHVLFKREDDKIKFAVVDTGFGLTQEDKAKLFTEGGKSIDSLSINIDSTGYGLYIAKKIVEKHQGKIGAHSEGRNKGSEFFVILPDMQ